MKNIKLFENFDDPLNSNKVMSNLLRDIFSEAGWYCFDVRAEKIKFINWLQSKNVPGINMAFAKSVVMKNDSWCTDNEGDMRALLSVISGKDMMGEYAEDYEPFEPFYKDKQSGKIISEEEMDDQLDSFYLIGEFRSKKEAEQWWNANKK